MATPVIIPFVWPEKIVCHGDRSKFTRSEILWRAAAPEGYKNGKSLPGPYGYPFRTCSYCGSIHPEDLHRFLTDPRLKVELRGSDWKYNWPHKFYVEGIPNPLVGQDVIMGGKSNFTRAELENDPRVIRETITPLESGKFRADFKGVGPVSTHAKWYNLHLNDFIDAPTFEAFAQLIAQRSGVQFGFKNGVGTELLYHAPCHGYQR